MSLLGVKLFGIKIEPKGWKIMIAVYCLVIVGGVAYFQAKTELIFLQKTMSDVNRNLGELKNILRASEGFSTQDGDRLRRDTEDYIETCYDSLYAKLSVIEQRLSKIEK